MSDTILIGICGGSGSGKTTLAKNLQEHWGEDRVGLMFQDSFYHDQSHLFDHDGGAINFDHPESLDFKLMAELLHQLKIGQDVQLPVYDFQTHSRQKETAEFKSKPIVLVDGILLFSQEKITELLSYKIFVDTPEKIRLERRVKRDVEERGRTEEGVLKQFFAHVKPMHDRFIEPFKDGSLVLSGLVPEVELLNQVSAQIQIKS